MSLSLGNTKVFILEEVNNPSLGQINLFLITKFYSSNISLSS
jgi:hypothetical protein